MAVVQLADDLHVITGLVNVYVLDTAGGCTILDTGFPGSAGRILEGIASLGKKPEDVRHILLSHAHPDHIGSAAALKRETGATVWAHPLDASIIMAGHGFRQTHASPGLRNNLLAPVLRRSHRSVEPTHVDRHLIDGQSVEFASDLTIIHVPGHSAGQVAFIWRRHGGVLFPADACVNRRGMALPATTEDHDLALASLEKLSKLDFDVVCFMHGPPITTGGSVAFRQKWDSTARKTEWKV